MGNAPDNIKKFLLNLLSWNDNSKNEYSDDHFVANLIESLGNAFIVPFDGQNSNNPNVETFDLYCESLSYSQETLETLDRYLTRHKLFNSYGNYVGIRIAALNALIDLELHHRPEIAQYFTFLAECDSDLTVRRFLQSKFGEDRGPQCWELPKRNAPLRLLRVLYRRPNANHTAGIAGAKPSATIPKEADEKNVSKVQEVNSDVDIHENGEDMPLALRSQSKLPKKKTSSPSNQKTIPDTQLSKVKNIVELKNVAKKAKVNKAKKSEGHSEKHKKIKLSKS
ncbi:3504_t:CDS:2, partial [Acaulospora colombiana]